MVSMRWSFVVWLSLLHRMHQVLSTDPRQQGTGERSEVDNQRCPHWVRSRATRFGVELPVRLVWSGVSTAVDVLVTGDMRFHGEGGCRCGGWGGCRGRELRDTAAGSLLFLAGQDGAPSAISHPCPNRLEGDLRLPRVSAFEARSPPGDTQRPHRHRWVATPPSFAHPGSPLLKRATPRASRNIHIFPRRCGTLSLDGWVAGWA